MLRTLLRSQILVCSMLIWNQLFSQVSITAQDILDLAGSKFALQEDTTGAINVNTGAPGENQTWDLSDLELASGFGLDQEFLLPAETPYTTNFPTSNLVIKLSSPAFSDGAIYEYLEVGATEVRTLGSVVMANVMGIPFENITEDNQVFAPVPVTFGSTWSEVIRDTIEQAGSFTNFLFDSTAITVDGWGTLSLPHGNFSCLRLFEQCWTRSRTLVNGVLTSSSADSALSYIWVSPENFLLATITSQDGETDPAFTDAGFVSIQTEEILSAPVLDEPAQRLSILGPNPTSDHIVIGIDLIETADVDLGIFTLDGKRIRTLLSGNQPAGYTEIIWDGVDLSGTQVPAATYLIRLKAFGRSETQKVIWVRE